MNLLETFNSITAPKGDDKFQFSALPIPKNDNHRIAKDLHENPVLLISISKRTNYVNGGNIKLQNVSVFFNTNCNILINQNLIERNFTVVYFTGRDQTLRKYFLKLCSILINSFGNTPSDEDVRKEMIRFIDLFRLATEPQTKTVQGLWAELFLIAESRDPANLLRCWHRIPEEKFDFNNGEERIEVKSSSNSTRIHYFSLDQLHSPTDTKIIIASLFVKQTSAGKSIENLINEIADRIPNQIELTEKLQLQIAAILGKAIIDSLKIKFDFQVARDSLKFYKAEDVPKILLLNIPPLVTDVHFKSDLTDLTPIDLNNNFGSLSLFKSI